MISHPNPTAHPEGVGEASVLTSRSSGRHRAAHRAPATTLRLSRSPIARPQFGAGPVAKAGAVIAVSGGLVASLGMQASASPASTTSTAATGSSAATSAAASGLPGSLSSTGSTDSTARTSTVTSTVAAPQSPRLADGQFGEIGFTATAAPKPKPVVTEPARSARPFTSRSSNRTSTQSSSREESSDEQTRGAESRSNGESSSDASSSDDSSAGESSAAPASIRAGSPGSADFGAAVLSIASRYDGIAYRYGGTTPAGFDCSGFTSYVLAQVGVGLPRTSGAQRGAATRISRSEAVPGDLVFMPGHVGIYAGNGMMWDSPRSGKSVSKRPVYSGSATYGRVG